MDEKGRNKFFSVKLVGLLLSITGIWLADTEKEERLLSIFRKILIMTVLCCLVTTVYETFTCDHDFYSIVQVISNSLPVVAVIIKSGTFLYHRKRLLRLLRFTEKHFWNASLDTFSQKVMKKINNITLILISAINLNSNTSNMLYMLHITLENIGVNVTDRTLPYETPVGFPKSETPYFQINFAMQLLSCTYLMICYCCFDSLLCVLVMCTAGQFEILGHRLENVFKVKSGKNKWERTRISEEFGNCLERHCLLISYVDEVNSLFNYTVLSQIILSNLLICMSGLQAIIDQDSFLTRAVYITYTVTTIVQLWMCTTTIDELTIKSNSIIDVIYCSDWVLHFHQLDKKVKIGMLMMMNRSTKPSSIKAGFLPVTTQTFTSVMRTAFSFLTLMRTFEVSDS